MTKDEALKLALEALERFEGNKKLWPEAITAIKEALAQPEGEYERGFIDGMQKQMQSSVDKAVNAMTQPTYYIPNKDDRTWVGLTNQEMLDFIEEFMGSEQERHPMFSEGYDLALLHMKQLIEGRSK